MKTDDEFARLSMDGKLAYLLAACRALEEMNLRLERQVRILQRSVATGRSSGNGDPPPLQTP